MWRPLGTNSEDEEDAVVDELLYEGSTTSVSVSIAGTPVGSTRNLNSASGPSVSARAGPSTGSSVNARAGPSTGAVAGPSYSAATPSQGQKRKGTPHPSSPQKPAKKARMEASGSGAPSTSDKGKGKEKEKSPEPEQDKGKGKEKEKEKKKIERAFPEPQPDDGSSGSEGLPSGVTEHMRKLKEAEKRKAKDKGKGKGKDKGKGKRKGDERDGAGAGSGEESDALGTSVFLAERRMNADLTKYRVWAWVVLEAKKKYKKQRVLNGSGGPKSKLTAGALRYI